MAFPFIFPFIKLCDPILSGDLGRFVTGFHVHLVDSSISETGTLFEESKMCEYMGLKVRLIRSSPIRPICEGSKTDVWHIDHFGIDFLSDPYPTLEQFDSIRPLLMENNPKAIFLTQDNPSCHYIKVRKKIWAYIDSYPPLEIALGPKSKSDTACNPRPAWPDINKVLEVVK